MGPQGGAAGRLRHRRAESCCMENVRQCYSPNSLKHGLKEDKNRTAAQEGSKMTLLALLCTSKLHLLSSDLIAGAGTLFSTCWLICVSNCEEKPASAWPPLTQAQNGGRLKQLLRLFGPSGAPVWKHSPPLHSCYYSDCWAPV